MQETYIGRFAPSPSGPLHYGSLLAAVASYLQAKHNHGEWLVRIEDIDPPREVKGAASEILRTLEQFQFEWHHTPMYQSSRLEYYRHAIDTLHQQKLLYACSCSRKEIAEISYKTIHGIHYPGTCRDKNLLISNPEYCLRVRTYNAAISFTDGLFGKQTQNLVDTCGDFTIFRKFGLPTYALAVTVDDAHQKITEVVRGYDLLSFTPIQIYLCQLFQLPIPKFLHIPIALADDGHKLSKQTGAKPVLAPAMSTNPAHVLAQVLQDLGQQPPSELKNENLNSLWSWAISNWKTDKIPNTPTILYKDNFNTQ